MLTLLQKIMTSLCNCKNEIVSLFLNRTNSSRIILCQYFYSRKGSLHGNYSGIEVAKSITISLLSWNCDAVYGNLK